MIIPTNIGILAIVAAVLTVILFSFIYKFSDNTSETEKKSSPSIIPASFRGLDYEKDIVFLEDMIEYEWKRQFTLIQLKNINYMNTDELNDLTELLSCNVRRRLSQHYLDMLSAYFSEVGLTEYIFTRSFDKTTALGLELQKRRFR